MLPSPDRGPTIVKMTNWSWLRQIGPGLNISVTSEVFIKNVTLRISGATAPPPAPAMYYVCAMYYVLCAMYYVCFVLQAIHHNPDLCIL